MGLIGERFNVKHAAGTTRYQVDRAHRHSGMFECVAIRGVEGTHHFIGSIQVFSRQEIERAMVAAWLRDRLLDITQQRPIPERSDA